MADKSPKKQRTTKKKPAVLPPAEQIQPGLKDYIRATAQLAVGWLRRNRLIVLGVVLLAVAVLAVPALLRQDRALTDDELIVRVSRELGISGDPNPAILTVTDASKVGQPFLDGAKNGDKILLYYKTKKSVLFRPGDDRVVREGSYTPPDAKLFIRNGTTDDARISAAKEQLKDLKNLVISSQDTGAKRDYARTVVVNVTDRYDDQVRNVAEALGAEVARLPRGETIPDADILVIVGLE